MTPVSVPTESCADAAFKQATVATNANAEKHDLCMLNLLLVIDIGNHIATANRERFRSHRYF